MRNVCVLLATVLRVLSNPAVLRVRSRHHVGRVLLAGIYQQRLQPAQYSF